MSVFGRVSILNSENGYKRLDSNYSVAILMSHAQGYRAVEICSRQVSESGQKKVLLLSRGTVSTADGIVRNEAWARGHNLPARWRYRAIAFTTM